VFLASKSVKIGIMKYLKYFLIRTSIRKLLSRMIFSAFINKPLSKWPKWAGKVCGINLPKRITKRKILESGGSNINIIFKLLDITGDIEGQIAECGVYQGHSLVPIGLYLKQENSLKKVYGFDSFEGFNEEVKIDIDLGGDNSSEKKIGGFDGTSYNYLRNLIKSFKLTDKIKIYQGYFEDTLSNVHEKKFSFVHLDCDLYSPYKACLEFFYPRMSKDGIILLDEYNDPSWPGCNKAVDEFIQTNSAKLSRIEDNNYVKYFIKKSNE
jgi:O-methyltransferase